MFSCIYAKIHQAGHCELGHLFLLVSHRSGWNLEPDGSVNSD